MALFQVGLIPVNPSGDQALLEGGLWRHWRKCSVLRRLSMNKLRDSTEDRGIMKTREERSQKKMTLDFYARLDLTQYLAQNTNLKW